MLIIPYILIILFLLFFRKKQRGTWIIAATIITVLSVTTQLYADLDNYEPLFNYYNLNYVNIGISTTNVLWAFLCKFFYYLGFNYRGMIVCLIFLNYYFLHKAMKNLECNENIFFGLFLIFPSLIQLIQLKFFTATTLVIYAYSILIKEKRFSLLLFIILTLVASLIHSSVLIFAIFVLVKKKKLNTASILLITMFISVFLCFNLNAISAFVKNFISQQQFNRYIGHTTTPSSILWILAILFSWCACYFISYLVMNYSENDSRINNKFYLKKNMVAINLLLLSIPLLLLDRNMHRFLEIGYSLMMAMIGMIIKDKIDNKNKLTILFITIFVLLLETFIYTPYDSLEAFFSYGGEIINIWR